MSLMGERDEFLAWVDTELTSAEIALHNGDAGPRRAIWSRAEPVTILGAVKNAIGRAEVDELFTLLEKEFSDATSYEIEIVAADVIGDLAYTVGFEHTQVSVNGEPRSYTLRATQIYRRENGSWKVVHRHGDTGPADEI
jgi:ketosteroid isomerase-like protein